MKIPFTEWKPDSPDFGDDDIEATNVLADPEGYRPMASPYPHTNALTKRVQGAAFARKADGTAVNIAGDANDLYLLGANRTFAVASKTAGAYLTGDDDRWAFVQWGNQVLATNNHDPVQTLTLGGAAFADLGGSPPKARHIAVVRDFVVLADVTDPTDGRVPQRVQWSGINSETTWGYNAAAQSDSQDLVGDGGWNMALVGGEYGTVFQERSIWRMTYVGSPAIFRFDEVEKERGALTPGAVASIGHTSFYLASDGFYAFNGVMSEPIGVGRVNKWFFRDLDYAFVHRISSAVDPLNTTVFWSYPSTGAGGVCDRVIAYNWAVNKWTMGEMAVEQLARALSEPLTLEDLNAFGNLDQLGFSLDSRELLGGIINLVGYDSQHRMSTFIGPALNAVITAGEIAPDPGATVVVNSVRPLIEGGTAQVSVGTRMTLAGNPVYTAPVAVNSIGECRVRACGRYVRFRMETTGDFGHALGVDATLLKGGGR